MIVNVVAKRYAKALFQVGIEQNLLRELESDLALFSKALQESKELTSFLTAPEVSVYDKKKLVTSLFSEYTKQFSLNLLLLLIDARRIEVLPAILTEYTKLANDALGIVDAEIVTAHPMTIESQGLVKGMLSKKTGKTVQLRLSVDPKIIGGIVLRIADRVFDASIRTELKKMKSSLINAR